jgi:hypothetical protein
MQRWRCCGNERPQRLTEPATTQQVEPFPSAWTLIPGQQLLHQRHGSPYQFS